MEKIGNIDFDKPRLKAILKSKGYSNERDYLIEEGFIQFKDLGWCRQDRVDECTNKGYIRFDDDGEPRMTKKGCFVEFLGFLWGHKNSVFIPKVEKKKGDVDGFFE